MQLFTGYRYYCYWPDRSLPGFLATIEGVEPDLSPVTDPRPVAPLALEPEIAIVKVDGQMLTINTAWFIEPTKLEWRLAAAFSQLGWSREKATRWLNDLFPLSKENRKLLRKGQYGLDGWSSCPVGHWQDSQLKIAVEQAEKYARRKLKLETKHQHPLKK